ncbi:MAG: VWA domain-containing protein [Candidatus Aminicenantes bacterium]|nr:VWA domain-containing protein [Candidatus Aminicenantes bacterium]
MTKTRHFVIVLCLGCLSFIAGLSPQLSSVPQEAVRPQKPLQYEARTTIKLIQVIVLDKQGKPVTDLKKEDFVLSDNGQEMKLTEFEKHLLSLPSVEKPAEERVAATPLPAPRLLNRKYFLFFDFVYNNPAGVRKMGEVARNFLETQILPTDEIGVLSFSFLKRLQVHLYLTTDHERVRKLISKIGLRDSTDRFEDLEDKYQRELKAAGLADERGETKYTQPMPEMPQLDLAEMWRLHSLHYIDGLTALAIALRSIPGQKHLVLFSEGIPYPVAYPPGTSAKFNRYEILLRELQTSNVAVHALYTGGITLSDWLTGAWTLAKTSYDTGGQYWLNMYNYEPFVEKVNVSTGSYYVLGYPISETWDGKYHRIRVTVKRPGCDVRAQFGYFNPKPFSDYTDLEKTIQLVDLALADKPLSQTPDRFEMAALPFSGDPAGNLVFAARIPKDKLTSVAGKKVEVVSLVFNPSDEIVELRRSEEDLTKVGASGAYLLSVLAVPPGAYRCRLVIRNLETGAAAVAGVSTAVPEAKASGIALLPPTLWKPERNAFYLKVFTPKATGKSPTRSLSEILGFDTRQYVPYTEKTLSSPSEIWASFRCAVAKIAAPKIKISAFFENLELGGSPRLRRRRSKFRLFSRTWN